ncbi:MAG TPA: hypothetical protein VM328_08640 [Fimbriimonadaceae bacterium]|nr:hypothetical protein [Fimbriimonadaceae bacterium]
MNNLNDQLRPFVLRVRIVRSWRGLALGACLGAGAASVWAVLDWTHVSYTDWLRLGLLTGTSALLGALAGWLRPVHAAQVADSIDRRAGLQDRLKTSFERADRAGSFDEALHEDAQAKLQGLRPTQLYPIRMERPQGAALVLSLVAACVFLLGNTPILLSEEQRKAREELEKAGQAVERVLKDLEQHGAQVSAEDERRLAEELRRLAKELEKGRLSKEEALQRANELKRQAEELVKDRAQLMEAKLAEAESAYEKLQKAELEKMGLADLDPKTAQELASMSDADVASARNSLEQQAQSLRSQLNSLRAELRRAGNDQQRKDLAEQISALESELAKAMKDLENLKLSQEVRDMLKRMQEHPLFKEIQELAKKLRQAAQEAKEQGSQQKLTHEQIQELQKGLEELAKQLQDDEAMREYLQKMLEAMQAGCGT